MTTVPASGLPTAGVGTRIILARHGQTDYNKAQKLQGQIDIPLNVLGERQAHSLGAAFQDDAPDLIVASPLARARQTARLVADRAAVPDIVTDPAFLERGFGQWEGLTRAEIREGWPETYTEWIEQRPVIGVGVEPRADVGRRVAEACLDLARQRPGGRILVVAHGAAITLGITVLLGLDAESFRGIGGLENCHRSVLEVRPDDDGPAAVRLQSHNLAPDFA